MRLQDIVAKLEGFEGWIGMFDSADAPVIDKWIAVGKRVAPTIDSLVPRLNVVYKKLEPFINKVQAEPTLDPELQKALNDILADVPELKDVLPLIQAMLPDILKVLKVIEANS